MSNPSTIGFQTGRRWMMIVAMLAIGAMLLAACGGDDDDDEDEPTAPEATEAPAEEETPEEAAASPAASPVGSPVGSPAASPVGSPVGSPAASPVAPVAPVVEDEATPAESPAASPAASPGASPVAGDAITVDMVEFAFEPQEITIPAGTDVEVTLTNSGTVLHDFTIEELDINEDVEPGASTTVTINAAAGTYDVVCTEPGHEQSGMTGTLTVE